MAQTAQLVDLDGLNKAYKISKKRLDLVNGVDKDHNENEVIIGKDAIPKGPNTVALGISTTTDTYLGNGNSNVHTKEVYMSEKAFVAYDDKLKAITFNFI